MEKCLILIKFSTQKENEIEMITEMMMMMMMIIIIIITTTIIIIIIIVIIIIYCSWIVTRWQ